jgi:hypothetical protein
MVVFMGIIMVRSEGGMHEAIRDHLYGMEDTNTLVCMNMCIYTTLTCICTYKHACTCYQYKPDINLRVNVHTRAHATRKCDYIYIQTCTTHTAAGEAWPFALQLAKFVYIHTQHTYTLHVQVCMRTYICTQAAARATGLFPYHVHTYTNIYTHTQLLEQRDHSPFSWRSLQDVT